MIKLNDKYSEVVKLPSDCNIWTKLCGCGKIMKYSRQDSLNNSILLGRKCHSCSQLNKTLSQHTKDLISKNNANKGKPAKNRKEPFKWLYNRLISAAYVRGIAVAMSFEDFLTFTKISNCHYCGKDIKFEACHNAKTTNYAHNIDRKDNTGPYSKDNCVAACFRCNQLKKDDISYEKMVKIGKILSEA